MKNEKFDLILNNVYKLLTENPSIVNELRPDENFIQWKEENKKYLFDCFQYGIEQDYPVAYQIPFMALLLINYKIEKDHESIIKMYEQPKYSDDEMEKLFDKNKLDNEIEKLINPDMY